MSYYDTSHTTTGTAGDSVSAATGSANAASTSETLPRSPSARGSKKRRSSKMKSGKQLSRSVSTPQMRDGLVSDSDSDKKRNKLGYQRISIACAHCRRRKIRCVLVDGDTNQKCQNCVRLKKECVFYPVEQQTAMENRPEAASKAIPGSGPPSVVSSSPNNGSDRPFDTTRDFAAFSSLPSSTSTTYEGLPLEPGSALHGHGNNLRVFDAFYPESDHETGGYPQSDFGYPPTNDSQPFSSQVTFAAPSDSTMSRQVDSMSMSYARFNQPGIGGDFAPFPTNEVNRHHINPHAAQNFAFGQERRNDSIWHPPRSLSYGQVEPLPGNNASFTPAIRRDEHTHPSHLRFPPTFDVPGMAHEAGPHPASVSEQASGYGHPYSYVFQQDQGIAENESVLQQQTYPVGWYGGQSSFGPLAEEPEIYGSTRQRPG